MERKQPVYNLETLIEILTQARDEQRISGGYELGIKRGIDITIGCIRRYHIDTLLKQEVLV